VASTRLKSSFIYLANAVNDLRAQWAALAIVLAPLVLIASVCFLPDALNIQHLLAERFAPGLHHVGWMLVQTPYAPATEEPVPTFPSWVVMIFHILLALLGLTVQLFVMCTIRRVQAGVQDAAGMAVNSLVSVLVGGLQKEIEHEMLEEQDQDADQRDLSRISHGVSDYSDPKERCL